MLRHDLKQIAIKRMREPWPGGDRRARGMNVIRIDACANRDQELRKAVSSQNLAGFVRDEIARVPLHMA